jgi:hypothetical protein
VKTQLTAKEEYATRERLRIWREAEPALEEQRWRELRALTDEGALRMTKALLARQMDRQPARDSSGLVEQQALFQRSLAR